MPVPEELLVHRIPCEGFRAGGNRERIALASLGEAAYALKEASIENGSVRAIGLVRVCVDATSSSSMLIEEGVLTPDDESVKRVVWASPGDPAGGIASDVPCLGLAKISTAAAPRPVPKKRVNVCSNAVCISP